MNADDRVAREAQLAARLNELSSLRDAAHQLLAKYDAELATVRGKLKTLRDSDPLPAEKAPEVSAMTQALRNRPARNVIP